MRRLSFIMPSSRRTMVRLAACLSIAVSLAGCGPGKSPVLEGDLESVVALKAAGAVVHRLPSVGAVNPGTGELDLSGVLLRVDLSDASIDQEIMEHLNNTPTVKELTLTGKGVNDELLSQLTNFKSFVSLDLSGSKVTDAGIQQLGSSLQSIGTLILDDTQVTGAGLSALPQVSGLSLANLPIGDGDLKNLEHLKALSFLTLSGTQVTPSGLAKFKKGRHSMIVVGIKQN